MRSLPWLTARRCITRSTARDSSCWTTRAMFRTWNARSSLTTRCCTFCRSHSSDMADHKKFAIEERVRWGDVDAARIIFYGAYIHFFEFAETELFREVGLHYGVMFDELRIWLPRVHLECDFHRAARLDDILVVSVWVG